MMARANRERANVSVNARVHVHIALGRVYEGEGDSRSLDEPGLGC